MRNKNGSWVVTSSPAAPSCRSVTMKTNPVSPAAGCPIPGTLTAEGENLFRDPPPITDSDNRRRRDAHAAGQPTQLEPDGIRVPASDVTSFRIFRQGYPYLEPHSTEPFRVGLNFVSFQNSPERLIGMLTTGGWLGGTNFGGLGPGAASDFQLLTAYAAGMFFVPPFAADDPFPGHRLLAG